VVSVRHIDEPDFLGGEVQRVSIFMNVFNVHVNRYPVDGSITYRKYSPGAFVNAAAEKASLENEQSSVGIVTTHGKVLVRQIAGLIARRIITDHGMGAAVRQGERMGLIRFGSRVDVFLPTGVAVKVAEGERTVAGVSIIGEWP
jgi:phosphatidylserine decarboxylase